MTSRERILAAINHQPCDRLPLDYWAVPEITKKLHHHFNTHDIPSLSKALGIDKIIPVEPILTPSRPNMWNLELRDIPLPNGATYQEPIRFPLEGLDTIADIEANYTFPSVDMYDYSTIPAQCDAAKGFAIEGGFISITYFYELIRGTTQMMIDFIADPDLATYILERIFNFAYEHTRRILEAADGRIDITQVTDDLGSQNNLRISPAMIDRYLRSYYDKSIALVRHHRAKVFHHDDGAITSAIPWLLDRGIEVLNPLQWHLPGWDLRQLKQDYGHRLCFHGGIDNQHVLPFGTENEITQEVRTCVETLFADNTGYILAPCHNIQSNTPLSSILHMYQTARTLSP